MSADNTPGVPRIGSRIALTSIGGQRYTGILCNVDLHESSITLQDVTLGADDAPKGEVFNFIKFRGCDIASLDVLPNEALRPTQFETQQSSSPPSQQAKYLNHATAGGGPIAPSAPEVSTWSHPAGAPGPLQHTPTQSQQQQQQQQQQPVGSSQSGTVNGGRMAAPTVMITPAAPPRPHPQSHSRPPQPSHSSQQHQQQQYQAHQQQGPSGGPSQHGRGRRDPSGPLSSGRGNGRGQMRAQIGNGPPRSGRGPGMAGGPRKMRPDNVPAADFDFAAALSKFKKEDVQQETDQGAANEATDAAAPSAVKYEKDDFFDELSCEALERMKLAEAVEEGGRPVFNGRARAAEQRKVDMETFGEVHQGRGFGGWRGRGRGRGYRGRGDGGRSGRGQGPGRGGGRIPRAMPEPQPAA